MFDAIFHNMTVKNGIFPFQYAVSDKNIGKNEKTWVGHKGWTCRI